MSVDAHPRVAVFLLSEPADRPERDASPVDTSSVEAYAATLPGVIRVQRLASAPRPDPLALAAQFRRDAIEVVVLAGANPGALKPAFTRAMDLAGADPARVRLARYRRGGAPGHATEAAQAAVACAVLGVPYHLATIRETRAVHAATLVIGGGVAGIQAALEIADAGQRVVLVEKTGTLGGHMAMFDKTFPTLDCAACILTPKMVAVGQHEMIEVMTLSEVIGVEGAPGNYRVEIRNRARRVDPVACVACHACMEVCPTVVPSEFDAGITTRKAIYMPFPQAVPNAYLIDAASCVYVQSEGQRCGACVKKCAKQAIDLDAEDEVVVRDVGNIIVATGYEPFPAERVERYGFRRYPNVLTALEFERLTNASGPTGGRIVTKTKRFNKRRKVEEWVCDPEGPQPASVAIIHCVGSRDRNHNPYCSRVCCMYSLKFAHLVREKLPNARCYEFYIDMRAFGKGYEEFFERIKEEGVAVVRGRSAKVIEKDGQMVVRGEDILGD
ncbi:MAG: FAD-dependent oxidoreductase, partial [Acidobacteria bacterium]|nr:FAD-dependent oxidoreductase [Acidobacteriota bacterium]